MPEINNLESRIISKPISKSKSALLGILALFGSLLYAPNSYATEPNPAKSPVSVEQTQKTTTEDFSKESDFVYHLDYLRIRRELKINVIDFNDLLRKKPVPIPKDNQLLENVLKLNELYTNNFEKCTTEIKETERFKKGIIDLSTKLGYKAVKDLTAKEYMLWCCDIVRYLTTYIKDYNPKIPSLNDKITLDKLVSDSNFAENGIQAVCRHQSAYVQAIFNNFKHDNLNVANVYCTYDRNSTHAWVLYYIITEKKIYAAQVDITEGNKDTDNRFRKWYSNYPSDNYGSWNFSPGVWHYRGGKLLNQYKHYKESLVILEDSLKQFDRYYPFKQDARIFLADDKLNLLMDVLSKFKKLK
jgi:hypothetical protein